jgi:lysophospholipase L1-like esterase
MVWLRRGLAAATAGPVAVLTAQMWWVRAKFKLPPDACGPLSGVCSPAEGSAPPSGRARNIIFLGDSIVTGVGCTAEASEHHGPVMPRRVAAIIAQQLGERVNWTCLGETGADVRMLHSRLLPVLQQEARRVSDDGQRVDAVVVMTGLNDIKECFLFAQPVSCHPWRFGALLTSVLTSVCESAGAGCALLVPGHPIEATPRFNQFWPLSAAVRCVTCMWEDQKRRAAEAAHALAHDTSADCMVRFVEPPPAMVAQLLDGSGSLDGYFAADGMHPNDAGYALWADIIAQRLLCEWSGAGAASSGAGSGGAASSDAAQPATTRAQ